MLQNNFKKIHTTHSYEETYKLGFDIAKHISEYRIGGKATVFALQGDLGSGKTTFAQGFAAGLGITEKVLSPTFVIVKSYEVPDNKKTLYHIDCYRLGGTRDLLELDWKGIIESPDHIVLLEWPERVENILPAERYSIQFKSIDESTRQIIYSEPIRFKE